MKSTMKKILIWSLLVAMIACMLPAVASADSDGWGWSRMYVKTDNGKDLVVRAQPNKNAKSLGKLKYGEEVAVDWSYAGNDGWFKILWGAAGSGYVQSRYLVSENPGKYVKPTTDPKKEASDLKKQQNELNKELKSEKEIEPTYIAVRPNRSTSKINFRVGPGTITSKITAYPDGKELIAIGETNNWYRARDPETDKVGYIYKKYTVKLDKKVAEEKVDETAKLGKLSVNGDFELTCKLPADYNLQVVNTRGESITASILSEDITKPEMYLDIAYDELYGEVERMNDLSEEDLAVLEAGFKEMNDVEISYKETGHGTKLLVAKEVGNDEDFVKILSIYKGYFIEFTMAPSSSSTVKTLTDEQIQAAIDFLTDVDFNTPAA